MRQSASFSASFSRGSHRTPVQRRRTMQAVASTPKVRRQSSMARNPSVANATAAAVLESSALGVLFAI